jgi:RNA polymerase sigma factor (TIGR02999 family)
VNRLTVAACLTAIGSDVQSSIPHAGRLGRLFPHEDRVALTADITDLLRRWGEGDAGALDQLFPIVYDRLRQLAHQRLRDEADGSLNTTGLVHEAYLKLVDSHRVEVRDRGHFLGLASRVMRHLLVDRARARNTAKRGQGELALSLEDAPWLADEDRETVTELDDALQRLEAIDQRRTRILEQRYFGGLTLEETAEALGISLATVKRELRSARAWLALELRREVP